MNPRLMLATVLVGSLVTVPLGAQGHGAPPASGVPHGSPHAQGAGGHGTPHTPQGPKSPNPGAGHAKGPGHANAGAKAGHAEGAHGPMTVQEHLAAQPQLAERLQALLPAGTTVDQAAAGFKNLGQFVAAVQVSKNLGIPFDQLKAQVTGTSARSLGEAIHTLKPDVDAKAEVRRAETAAHDMTDGSKP